MMAKETGACLAEIVRQAAWFPQGGGRRKGRGARQKEQRAPSADDAVNGWQQQPLLAAIGGVARVDAIGRMLLSALGRMKHMGGIQCTQVGNGVLV